MSEEIEFEDEDWNGTLSVWYEDDRPPFDAICMGHLIKDSEGYFRFYRTWITGMRVYTVYEPIVMRAGDRTTVTGEGAEVTILYACKGFDPFLDYPADRIDRPYFRKFEKRGRR